MRCDWLEMPAGGRCELDQGHAGPHVDAEAGGRMTDEQYVGLSYCARCHCGVPIDEWRVSPTLTAWKHVGPLRDHKIDRYVDADELGSTRCGWAKKVPVKI